MDGLKGPVEGGGRAVAVPQRHVYNPLPALQVRRRPGHPPPPEVLRQRHPRQQPKHPLKVVGGAAGDFRRLAQVGSLQALLQILHSPVQTVHPFHMPRSFSLRNLGIVYTISLPLSSLFGAIN